MALQLQNFSTLVKTQAAAVTASCQQIIDMTVGSVMRALLEANASVGLWMQWLIMQVLGATRASTSNGNDLDSWVADFGMSRLASVAAAGNVIFTRTTGGLPAMVAAGALVRTGTNASDQIFVVVGDSSNPAWTGVGYALSGSQTSVTARVQAQQVGIAGNVVAQSITMLATPIPGIDGVTNSSPMMGGTDAETDDALRTRFAGFLDSRNRATSQAVGFAITSVRQGVSYTIAERVDASGATRPGHFTITVDDGSGTPSNDFLNAVAQAVDLVRPIGSTFSLRPPLIIPVIIGLHVVAPAEAVTAVQSAITAYITTMPIGAVLTATRLYQLAYSADARVTNAYGANINGSNDDYIPPVYGLLRPSAVTVTA